MRRLDGAFSFSRSKKPISQAKAAFPRLWDRTPKHTARQGGITHTADEWIELAQVERAADMLGEVMAGVRGR